jgi:SAM-dependent methyltransferase
MTLTPPDWLAPLLTQSAEMRDLGDGVASFLPPDSAAGGYDRFAALYDAVVSNRAYNAAFWGVPPAAHPRFAAHAIASAPAGVILDCPCGSLLFTARLHPPSASHRLLLVDRSEAMLRRARDRLPDASSSAHACLVQGDLFHLPLRPGSLAAVTSYGGLHLFAERRQMITTFWDLLRPGGRLFLSTLIAGERSTGDWLLRRLHRAGQVAKPFGREELLVVLPPHATVNIRGSWAFVSAEKPPPHAAATDELKLGGKDRDSAWRRP